MMLKSKSKASAKPKTCKLRTCRAKFIPAMTMQVVCGPLCAIGYSQQKKQEKQKQLMKVERAEHLAAKERIKTLGQHMAEAQQAFNAWVRERDRDLPCISCGRFHQGQWHAGHYRTVGSHPELRFEPRNVHKQCAPCNNHKSGNLVEYRINLADRIGAADVEWLEGNHEPKHYRETDIKEIKKHYRAALRELVKKRDSE